MTATLDSLDVTLPEPLFSEYPQPVQLYRMDTSGDRWYYTIQDGEPVWYISCTSLEKRERPPGPQLINFWKRNGAQADEIADLAAHYGTFFHIEAGMLSRYREIDVDSLRERVMLFKENGHHPWEPAPKSEPVHGIDVSEWVRKCKLGVASWAAFLQEHRVRPLSVEIILASEWGFAGAIDLVCEMEYKGKDIRAIVDIKTGNTGYESHQIQLALYRWMWEENFPDSPIDHVFNWRPKAWTKEPTYELKSYTKEKQKWALDKAKHIAHGFHIDGTKPSQSVVDVHGRISLDDDLSQNYRVVDIEDIAKERAQDI